MTRLAMRRTPARRTGYSFRQVGRVGTAKPKQKKAAMRTRSGRTPVFLQRTRSLMSNIKQYIERRRKEKGPTDATARKLSTIHTSLGRQIQKKNVITPAFVKTLKQINPAFKGQTVSKTLRSQAPKLLTFIRDTVRKDVISFVNMAKRFVTPVHNELKRLESQWQSQLRKAKKGKIQFKVDPAHKRRFQSIQTQLKNFKKNWYKKLNPLTTHGNKPIQTAVKGLKREIEMMEKQINKNMTIMNRYTGSKSRKGYRSQSLVSASQLSSCETKFNRMKKEFENHRIQVQNFIDQLKAIKLI